MKKSNTKMVSTEMCIREDEVVARELATLKYLSYSIPSGTLPIPDNLCNLSNVTLLTNGVIKLEDDKKDIYYIAHYDSYVDVSTVLGNMPNAIIVFKGELSEYSRNRALIITGERLQTVRVKGEEVVKTVDKGNLNTFNSLKQFIKSFHSYKSNPKRVGTIKDIVSVLSCVINERYTGEYNYDNHASVKVNFGYLSSNGLLEPIHRDEHSIHILTIKDFIPSVKNLDVNVNSVAYAREDVMFFNGVKIDADDQGKDILRLNRPLMNLRIEEGLRNDLVSTNANFLTMIYRTMSRTLLGYGSKPDVETMLNLVDTYTDKNELKLSKEFEGKFFDRKFTKLVEISLKTFNPNGCYIRTPHGDNGWFFVLRVIVNYNEDRDEGSRYTESTSYILPIGRISVSLMSDRTKGEFTIEKLASHVYEYENRSCLTDNTFAGHAIAKIRDIDTASGRNSNHNVHLVEILGNNGIREFLSELKKYFITEEVEVL